MRKPYFDLTADEQNAIHQWLDDHGVNHQHVPLDTQFTYDDQTGTWTVDRFKVNAEGKPYLDHNREIARETVTFTATRPLPWPKLDACPYCGAARTTTDAESSGGER